MQPTATSSEPTTIRDNALYLYVPTAAWPSVVEYYSVALNQEPKPAGPPEAVLQLPNGGELHIIATDDSQLLTQRTDDLFLNLPDVNMVENAYRIAIGLGAEPKIPLQTIDIYPVPDSETGQTSHVNLTLASVTFPNEAAAQGTDTTLGVIHNPNW
ncbi:hypothetical protein [Hymenobacter wooponensis]|uniref:Uncharacterized protein n=1 Tax=Hymenobacter wooponensis TaxID=1525360 RepID=A0A4Z0MSL7_9BACT|nr:hypothetical protein [Hymenobacter wooponensis]TGD82439.1 hypothetical protein EU557_01220 [Hymenobacter wooponensis]